MSGLPPRPDGAVPPPPGPRRETGGRFRGRDDRPPRGRGRGRGGDRAYNPRYARDSYPANDSFRDEYPERGDRGWQDNSRNRGYGRPYPESRPPRREPERDTYYAGAARGYDDRRDPYPSTSRDFPPPRGRYDRETSPRRDVYDRRPDYRRRTPSPRRGAYPPESPSMSRGRYPPDYERPSSRSSSRSRFTESPVVPKLQRESYDRPTTDNDELEAGQLISEPEPPSPPPPLIHRISSPRRSSPPPPPSRLPGRRRQPRRWDAPGPGRRRDASPPTQPRFRGNWQPIPTDRARTPSPPPSEEPKEEDIEMAPPPSAAEPQPSYPEAIPAEVQPEPAPAPGPPVPANHGDIVKQAYGNMPTPVIVPASAPSMPAPKKASWAKAAMVPANVHIVSTPAASTSQSAVTASQSAPMASQPAPVPPPPVAPTAAPTRTEPKDEPMEVDEVPAKRPTPHVPSPIPEIKSPELKIESPAEPQASHVGQPTPAQASPATPNLAHAPPPRDIKGKGRLGAPPSQPRGFTLPTEPRSMAGHANDSRGQTHPIPTGPRLNRNASLSTSTSGPSSLPAKPDSLPPTPVLPSPAAASPLARDSPAVAATPAVSLPPTPATSTPVAATLATPMPTGVMGSPSLGVAGSSDSPAILPPGGIKRELSTASSAPPEAPANAAEVKAEAEDPHHFRVRAYVPHHERQALARKRLKVANYEEPRTDLDALYDERQSFYAQLRSFQHAVARKNSEYAASAAATGRLLLEYELAGNEVRYAQMRHAMAEEQTELAKRGCLGVDYGK
ncbi:uncharacterized protein SCHCODRAFT_02484163 [Schizophyllum commune H4-8]|nr:uncharacterized protein SCHCODRAFT_02484163 [Schizophyllum commune H4-8]KAI5900243.1 hypothetical protein SCHCODRAFT_02484163 [Schizophyllum commune H4-8]